MPRKTKSKLTPEQTARMEVIYARIAAESVATWKISDAEREKKVAEDAAKRKADDLAFLELVATETPEARKTRLLAILAEKTRSFKISPRKMYHPMPVKQQLKWAIAGKNSLRFNLDFAKKEGRDVSMENVYHREMVVGHQKALDLIEALELHSA